MSTLNKYLPSIYKDIRETDVLLERENVLFDELANLLLTGRNSLFIKTANADAIAEYEKLVNIIPNPTEDLEFRRQRLLNRFSTAQPFTMKTLASKLDSIIGAGNWEAYMDEHDPYTLIIESSAENQSWYQELIITVNNSKPANIVFVNRPLISGHIAVNETVSYSKLIWNYKLGSSWNLGVLPFISAHEQGEIKGMSAQSIKPELLTDITTYTLSDIAKARINGSLVITNLIKASQNNVLSVEYTVPQSSGIVSVEKIELLDAENTVLTEATVFVPVLTDLELKHTIQVKEGQ